MKQNKKKYSQADKVFAEKVVEEQSYREALEIMIKLGLIDEKKKLEMINAKFPMFKKQTND